MKEKYREKAIECANCAHKSRIRLERDPSATWCLKLMIQIDHPQFACMFYQEDRLAPLVLKDIPAGKN